MFPLYDDNPTTRIPFVVLILILLNAGVFVYQQNIKPSQREIQYMEWGFVPARIHQLENQRPLQIDNEHLSYVFAPNEREIYRSIVTSLFLHGSWMHLIGNMWFLWIFGNNIEDRLGHARFAIFYLLGGLVATGCHWFLNPNDTIPVIGASGAISAVLGAYAFTFPHAKVKTLVFLVVIVTFIELPALAVLGFWFVQQLASAAYEQAELNVDGGVAWWAHVGGFVFGLMMIRLFELGLSIERNPEDHQADPIEYYRKVR